MTTNSNVSLTVMTASPVCVGQAGARDSSTKDVKTPLLQPMKNYLHFSGQGFQLFPSPPKIIFFFFLFPFFFFFFFFFFFYNFIALGFLFFFYSVHFYCSFLYLI